MTIRVVPDFPIALRLNSSCTKDCFSLTKAEVHQVTDSIINKNKPAAFRLSSFKRIARGSDKIW